MLLKDFLKEAVARLEHLYPVPEARSIVQMVCESRIGTSRYTHILEPGRTIEEESLGILLSDIDRLSAGEPVQYVLGFAEFCGRKFKVTPDVLVPRPETETLCQDALAFGTALKESRGASGNPAPVRILDLCTGSGCIAWTMALGIPGAEVTGTDISLKALSVASGQDFSSEMEATGAVAPDFVAADLLSDVEAFGHGRFDLVLSNPPYILESEKAAMRVNVLGFEPHLALFVPDGDPLVFHRAVARWSASLLLPGGRGRPADLTSAAQRAPGLHSHSWSRGPPGDSWSCPRGLVVVLN